MIPWSTMAPVAAIVLGAFAVEATLGFGATVIAVSLCVFFVPIQELLPIFVPANFCLSCVMVARHHREIDRRLLLGGILPMMALGMPLGLYAARHVESGHLESIFGALVVVLALPQLVRALRADAPLQTSRGDPVPHAAPRPPLPAPLRLAALFCAGVVHGTFATGGPLVVWVADRAGLDKGRFRATLSALWACLAVILLGTFGAQGRLSAATGARSVALVASVAAGVVLGEALHARLDAKKFRVVVAALLAGIGVVIVAR